MINDSYFKGGWGAAWEIEKSDEFIKVKGVTRYYMTMREELVNRCKSFKQLFVDVYQLRFADRLII